MKHKESVRDKIAEEVEEHVQEKDNTITKRENEGKAQRQT